MAQKGMENEYRALSKLGEQSKQMIACVTNPGFNIVRNPSQIEQTTREMASKITGQLSQTQITKAYAVLHSLRFCAARAQS